MIKKILVGLAACAALQGCSIGVDQMSVSQGMVATARNGYPFDETPAQEIKQRDSLIVITHLKWEPVTADAGTHAVNWTWYADDNKVVAVRKQNVRFNKTPYRLFWRMPAADFEPGHYKVVVAIDDKVIETHEYEIVK